MTDSSGSREVGERRSEGGQVPEDWQVYVSDAHFMVCEAP